MKNWNDPTPRQLECLRAIAVYQDKENRPPTTRELATYLGVKSCSTPYSFLVRLGIKGYIKRDPKLSRTIVILEAGRKALEEQP